MHDVVDDDADPRGHIGVVDDGGNYASHTMALQQVFVVSIVPVTFPTLIGLEPPGGLVQHGYP